MPRVACRVFSRELAVSDFIVDDTIVTPTCARCPVLFGIGELEEVEKRGRITRLTINDSTGSLKIYTDIEVILEPRALVAFLGEVRIRHSDGIFLIIGRNICEVTTPMVRENWILSTAIRTMERVNALRASDKPKWMQRALEHYGEAKLDECISGAVEAVQRLWQHYNTTAKEMILKFLHDVGTSSRERLMEELRARGLEGAWIEDVIEELIAEGSCYEPELGFLALVHE